MAEIGFCENAGKVLDHKLMVTKDAIVDMTTRAKAHSLDRMGAWSDWAVQSYITNMTNIRFWISYLWKGSKN